MRKAMGDKYSKISDVTAMMFLANAINGSGDKGQTVPYSDVEDLSRGLKFIPGEVTMARREGQRIPFVQPCSHQCCWYWQFPDQSKIYYFEQGDYEAMATQNGAVPDDQDKLIAGPCPDCGNPHTQGGHIFKEERGN
jgi:hypothetical protein